MTDEPAGKPPQHPKNDHTVMAPSTGRLHGPAPGEPARQPNPGRDDPAAAEPEDEPTPPEARHARPADETTPATVPPPPRPDDPTLVHPFGETSLAGPAPAPPHAPSVAPLGEPTSGESAATEPAVTDPEPAWPHGPTVVIPADEVVVSEWSATGSSGGTTTGAPGGSPASTGPIVTGLPSDEPLPPPPDPRRRPGAPGPAPVARRPGYYVALGAAVVLVAGLVAVAAFVTVVRPAVPVAGTALASRAVPDITTSNTPPTTTAPPRSQTGPAGHPLSTSSARMGDITCSLPRFDVTDDRQAAFYAAAEVCADAAWRGVLTEAGLSASVEVVTVTGAVRTRSCGEITPASPATQCDGTVYMTPAHLRDTERNGRYPGRYLGVFLREYARALQFTTGLAELAANVDDAEARLAQQATCMAGIASGAMAGRGAVDANITGEISARLSSVDAPPDAETMLERGFRARTLEACDTW